MSNQILTLGAFFQQNARWLLGGVLLTFFSGVGQTFFIASFAGNIRQEFQLSHGDFGALYMLATLASAATLIFAGRALDHIPVHKIAAGLIVALSAACYLFAEASSVPLLCLSIYFLRLLGQGMMSHTAMVAVGRWFVAERGRAVSVSLAGHQLGEAVLPTAVVLLLAVVDWRIVWMIAAGALLLVALPLSFVWLRVPRQPLNQQQQQEESGRQWTRAEALQDAPFWAICTGVLAPAFIGTSVFFHQIHISSTKGWPVTTIASSFALMSVTTVAVSLVAGQLIDRFSARQLLPFFLFPLSAGCLVLAYGTVPATMWLFMGVLGMSYGISNAVFGAIWPEVYGTRHLGAIRAVVSAAMVFASALGPGLTGWLIDWGIHFETQLIVMSGYCLVTMLVLMSVSKKLEARMAGAIA